MSESEPYKVVFLGGPDAGKEEIMKSLMSTSFGPDIIELMSAQFVKKALTLENGKSVTFKIWDTAGKEKYRSMAKLLYEDAKVVIFVYDITNKESFDDIKNYWYKEVKKDGNPEAILALVGNKYHLYEKQKVSDCEGEEYAKSINAIFTTVSKYSLDSINNLFEKIAKKIFDPNYDYYLEKVNEEKRYVANKNKKEYVKEKWKKKLEKYINF